LFRLIVVIARSWATTSASSLTPPTCTCVARWPASLCA
jgi:hypothetical protein